MKNIIVLLIEYKGEEVQFITPYLFDSKTLAEAFIKECEEEIDRGRYWAEARIANICERIEPSLPNYN